MEPARGHRPALARRLPHRAWPGRCSSRWERPGRPTAGGAPARRHLSTSPRRSSPSASSSAWSIGPPPPSSGVPRGWASGPPWPLLVWSPVATGPVRFWIVLAFVLFHLGGLAPLFVLGIFPWVSAVAWAVFLPSWFWRRIEGGALARALGRLRRAFGADALPSRRATSDPPVRRRWVDALVWPLLVYVLLINVTNVVAARRGRPPLEALGFPAGMLGIHQSWRMFAPRPATDDGWYVMMGRLVGGRTVDLWHGGPVDWSRPLSVSASLGDARWIKYLSELDDPEFVFHRRLFGDFLCRRWNREHAGSERLEELALVFMLEETIPPARELAPRPKLIWAQGCVEEAGRRPLG